MNAASDRRPSSRVPGPSGPPAGASKTTELPPALLAAARDVVRSCEAELAEVGDDVARAARLHTEIGEAYVHVLGDVRKGLSHFSTALGVSADYAPAIRGARDACLALGSYADALPHIEAAERLASSPTQKAALRYQKGRLLEDHLSKSPDAARAYAAAIELDPQNASYLQALLQCRQTGDDVSALSASYAALANAITDDSSLRGALISRRAAIVELDDAQRAQAAELYEAALAVDENALLALDGLERLHSADGRHGDLILVLERIASATTDKRLEAYALYRVGRLQFERLGNHAEAIDALERAAAAVATDPLILEDLARLLEGTEQWEKLAGIRRVLVDSRTEPRDKVSELHSLGRLLQTRLERPDGAIETYREALELDPTHVPTLQALGELLEAREDWHGMIAMYAAEAETAVDAARKAKAHGRIAEIFELRLRQADKAAEHHDRALSLLPGFDPSFKALGRIYTQAGRFRDLVELLERAVDESTSSTRKIAYLMKIGGLWEDALDDCVQAAQAYRRILRIDAEQLGAVHALQRVTERAGRFDELVEAIDLEVAQTTDPEQQVGLLHRAGTIVDERLDDRDGAIARLKKVLAIRPTFVPSLAALGRIYHREGLWSELLDTYRRELDVTSKGPAAAPLLFKMGELTEIRLGDEQRALEYYRAAADADRAYGPAIRALDAILRKHERHSEIADLLIEEARGIEDRKARAAVLFRAAEVQEERLQQYGRATESYAAVLETDSGHFAALAALTRLRERRREWRELVQDLTRIIAASRDDGQRAALAMRQAEVLRDHLGDTPRAIAVLEEILEAQPTYFPAWVAMQPLCAKVGAYEALARVHRRMAEICTDPGARIAALRELARVEEARLEPTPEAKLATYDAILQIDPSDRLALDAQMQIALRHGLHSKLAEVVGRLGQLDEDPRLSAGQLTYHALLLEAAGDHARALDTYRVALAKDSAHLAAVRGLGRVGAALADGAAVAEALTREAKITRRPLAAADLLVQAAGVRRGRLGDHSGAISCLERALEACPDHVGAADGLTEALIKDGQFDKLLDLLGKAANAAAAPERVAALWLAVAQVYGQQLNNRGSALAALARALAAAPDHMPCLLAQTQLYEDNGQFVEATQTLEHIIQRSSDRQTLTQAHLRLAALMHERLADARRARTHVEAALRMAPTDEGALTRYSAILLGLGDLDGAHAACTKLVDVASDDTKIAAALCQLGAIEETRGNQRAAFAALYRALALDGPSGPAAERLRRSIEDATGWQKYVDGLTTYMRRPGRHATGASYLEIARIEADALGLPEKALGTLKEGLDATSGDAAIAADLARRLRAMGRGGEAIGHLMQLLYGDAGRPGLWRDLSATLQQLGRSLEATLALAPLAVLGDATAEEVQLLRSRGSRPGHARPMSLTIETLRSFEAGHALSNPATQLLATLAEGIGKVHPPELDGLGLGRRDRISARAVHPLRVLCDQLAAVMGVAEYDLYEHQFQTPVVLVDTTDPPSIVVSSYLGQLEEAKQVFLLATAMAEIAGRFYLARRLGPADLAYMLAAVTHTVVPGFGAEVGDEETLAQYGARIRKTVSRRHRSAMEEAASRYAAVPCDDFATLKAALRQTAMRAALLLADDLVASVEALQLVEPSLSTGRGAALVRGSAEVADLCRFWVSDAAMAVRRHGGMIPLGLAAPVI